MKTYKIFVAVSAAALSALALAQAPTGQHAPHQGDTNRDQASEHASHIFAKLDINRDGQLTRAEAQSAHEKMRSAGMGDHGQAQAQHAGKANRHQAMFERMFDGKGSISLAEFQAAAIAHFDRLDGDKNGIVTTREHQEGAEKHR